MYSYKSYSIFEICHKLRYESPEAPQQILSKILEKVAYRLTYNGECTRLFVGDAFIHQQVNTDHRTVF